MLKYYNKIKINFNIFMLKLTPLNLGYQYYSNWTNSSYFCRNLIKLYKYHNIKYYDITVKFDVNTILKNNNGLHTKISYFIVNLNKYLLVKLLKISGSISLIICIVSLIIGIPCEKKYVAIAGTYIAFFLINTISTLLIILSKYYLIFIKNKTILGMIPTRTGKIFFILGYSINFIMELIYYILQLTIQCIMLDGYLKLLGIDHRFYFDYYADKYIKPMLNVEPEVQVQVQAQAQVQVETNKSLSGNINKIISIGSVYIGWGITAMVIIRMIESIISHI